MDSMGLRAVGRFLYNAQGKETMPGGNYVVKQGDCMSSIAAQFGFLWQTLWDLNPDLKLKRNNPNVLFPGDIVVIPELRVYEVSRPVDKRHVFVLKGTDTKFRLTVERSNMPMAHRRFILTVDDWTKHSGVTDSTGTLEVPIRSDAFGSVAPSR